MGGWRNGFSKSLRARVAYHELRVLKKIAAMEFHGEVRILEQISGENQHDRFIRLHKSLPHQFLQARQSNGGCGFAANPFGADLSFGLRDLDFANLLTGAAGGLNNFHGLFPRSRIADADRGGASLRLHAD